MYILFLIPIGLLILPVVAIIIALGHSARIMALEKSIAELKKQGIAQPAGTGNVQPVVAAQPVATAQPAPAPVPIMASPIATTATPDKPKIDAHPEDSSGRILGRIGIAAVLIGLAFFLKYAFDNNWIGPAGRVMIGIIIGMGFLGLGQYIRAKYLQYSDLLMGGGIVVLYLSVFAAHSFYGLIDSGTTGVFMFLVTLLSFAISITNATQTIALVSVIGAFATPTLTGSHDNSMMMLFGYMTIINLGVLGVSFFKKWPRLNLASFVGTAINFLIWFTAFYSAVDLGPTLIFVTITFIIFLVAQVARGITAGIKADEADYLLLGVNAFAFASMIYALLNPEYHGILGFVSVLVALVYMAVAFLVNKTNPQDTGLNIFLPALAVVFLSIAVPLQFSGSWIAVAWLIEACALYSIASVISNRGFQVMGLVVYCLGLFDYLTWYFGLARDPAYVPFFNAPFIILALAVVVAYVIAYIYNRYGSISAEIRQRGIVAFFIIANVLSLWALTMQITSYYAVQSDNLTRDHSVALSGFTQYSNGYDTRAQADQENQSYSAKMSSNGNVSNTLVSVLWTVYAAILTAMGFARRAVNLRRFGLVLFLVTAFKVVIDVWDLGELYRIISFIVFGVIALAASFGYIKYKDRLKEILSIALLVGISAVSSWAVSGGSIHTAEAAFVPTDWQYTRSISNPVKSPGFVKAILPTDISWTSQSEQFSDLRIIDGQGREVPYLLNKDQMYSGSNEYAKVLNLTSNSDGSTQFIADNGSSGNVYSAIAISIDGSFQSYRRFVTVYSSDLLLPVNDSRWSLVTSNGFIYRMYDPSSGGQIADKNSVSLGAHSARYLKVVISSGPEGALKVLGVTRQNDVRVSVGSSDSAFTATVYNDPKKKTTDVTIDLGVVGRLSNSATLDIGSQEKNYVRRVTVNVSDDMNSWRYVGNGSISRISTSIFNGSSSNINYSEQRARYVRLSIINDDNQPLSVGNDVSVSTSLFAVIFQADPGTSYSLYYGNPKAPQPEYDTAQLSSYIDQNNLPIAGVGPQIENGSYIAPAGPVVPFTESNKGLLNGLLVLVVIIIGGGVWWYLRSYMKGRGK